MFRIRLKFPYRGFPRIYRDGPPRIYITKRNCQSKSPAEAPGTKLKPNRKGVGGGATGFYYTVGTLAFITGATVAYAKYDPEFRAWLATQAPWTDGMLSIIFQEDKTWMEQITEAKKTLKTQTWKVLFGKDAATKYEKSTVEKRDVCLDTKEKQEYKLAITGEKQEKVQDSEQDLTKLPETHPRNLVDLEAKISESATVAIKAFNDAICALRDHSREVFQLVEESVERVDEKLWNTLRAKTDKKESALKEAEMKAQYALVNVHKLKAIIEDENFEAPATLKGSALRNVARVLDELERADRELQMEKKKSRITDRYWAKVEKARTHYTDELEILFPHIKISDKQWNISSHDLDLFILYCYQNVLYYQKELERLEVYGEERLKEALEAGQDGSEALIRASIESEVEKERRAMTVEFQKRMLNLKMEGEKELRLQLKRQAEAHTDHLLDAVAIREKELEREFLRMQDEKMASEQAKFKYQLAGMMGRLKGLETSLKARASADRNAHQAQLLWSACQALHSSISYSDNDIPWEKQLRPLEAEVNSIKKAALGEDDMVESILRGIPQEAIYRGVFCEEALRERFLSVEKIARRIALVPEGGGSLPVYFLSYLQSLLLIRAINPISQAELADEPVEFAHLDNYDILLRSRYWLDRGNFEMVLRYMNLLKGASRSAALDWMNEARILLETQQAANALMVHAGATGLLYI